MKKVLGLLCFSIIILAGCSMNVMNESIDIYTARDHEVDQIIFEDFTSETGIEVNVTVYDNDELVQKVISEKDDPVADVIIINGAQYIYELDQAGILQPINQNAINENINENFYGENYVGITARSRGIVIDPTKVDAEEIDSYADLADPKYQGEILVRTSTNGYNVALVENLIQVYGVEKTQEWATGIVNNMVHQPIGDDTDQIMSVANGEGSIAIVNSYYYYQLLHSDDPNEVEMAESLEIVFPEDAHINMTWLGVTSKGSSNDSVDELISFLTSTEVQQLYYDYNCEYALNSEVEMDIVPPTHMEVDFATLGENKEEALKIFDEANWI